MEGDEGVAAQGDEAVARGEDEPEGGDVGAEREVGRHRGAHEVGALARVARVLVRAEVREGPAVEGPRADGREVVGDQVRRRAPSRAVTAVKSAPVVG